MRPESRRHVPAGTGTSGPVLGADVCAGRWVGVVLDAGGGVLGVLLETTIGELTAAAAHLARAAPSVVAVDMPIGLAVDGPRECDRLARARLGRLAPSVFAPPVQAAAATALPYPDALAAHRAATGGVGLSRQAWGLGHKIREVAAWLTTAPGVRVVEAHPEVCFAAMHGAALPAGKRTWTGHTLRRGLLAAQGIELADDLGPAGLAGPDDVLDAAAAAWTARRVARGVAERLPAVPRRGAGGSGAARGATVGDHPAIWV